ncbi:Lysine-specific demethylase 3B [Kickxella alabastrina]|uniref:Lysine-specific demethylase 3B n=1 Tax=Kickxella alabastrina TaxID=61397 RepID=A0ACC1IUI6_9FUNG|nr:Lysine-specific demethylase 3B [Kickxella alabastrina]
MASWLYGRSPAHLGRFIFRHAKLSLRKTNDDRWTMADESESPGLQSLSAVKSAFSIMPQLIMALGTESAAAKAISGGFKGDESTNAPCGKLETAANALVDVAHKAADGDECNPLLAVAALSMASDYREAPLADNLERAQVLQKSALRRVGRGKRVAAKSPRSPWLSDSPHILNHCDRQAAAGNQGSPIDVDTDNGLVWPMRRARWARTAQRNIDYNEDNRFNAAFDDDDSDDLEDCRPLKRIRAASSSGQNEEAASSHLLLSPRLSSSSSSSLLASPKRSACLPPKRRGRPPNSEKLRAFGPAEQTVTAGDPEDVAMQGLILRPDGDGDAVSNGDAVPNVHASSSTESPTTTASGPVVLAKATPLVRTISEPMVILASQSPVRELSGVDAAGESPALWLKANGKAKPKPKAKPRRERNAIYDLGAPSIDKLISAQNTFIRISSNNNMPTMDQMTRDDFLPLVFNRTADEPAHFITSASNTSTGDSTRRYGQGLHEYAVGEFPALVDPDLWVAQQQKKYDDLFSSSGSEGHSVKVTTSAPNITCQVLSKIGGIILCRNCLNRKADCPCMFRNTRLVTSIVVSAPGTADIPFFSMTPMFLSQKSPSDPEFDVPRAVFPSLPILEQIDQAHWRTIYCRILTAPTLLPDLQTMRLTASRNTAHNGVEYAVDTELGCSSAPCVYRKEELGMRQLCDICETTILGVYMSCSMCGQEVCTACFAAWDDSDVCQRLVQKELGPKVLTNSSKYKIRACKRINSPIRVKAHHKKSQFVRMSQLAEADVKRIGRSAQAAIDIKNDKLGGPDLFDCDGPVSAAEMAEFDEKIHRLRERARAEWAYQEWEMPPVYVNEGELSTREFSRLLRRGMPVVVRELLDKLNADIWTPQHWITSFGSERVSILDCKKDAEPVEGGDWPLRDFYRLFDGNNDVYAAHFAAFDEAEEAAAALAAVRDKDKAKVEIELEPVSEANGKARATTKSKPDLPRSTWAEHKTSLENGILKLKDWPPTQDFQQLLPRHFMHFMASLPFREYTQRDGHFNLVNRLPSGVVPPDLGPKMYCAYGSRDDGGGFGTTNLHCDMSDAVNIMAYASKSFLRANKIVVPAIWTPEESSATDNVGASPINDKAKTAAAVWNIFPSASRATLRKFITEHKAEDMFISDAIHDQAFFLTRGDRQQLFNKYGAKLGSSYVIHQNPGDAVFVPAGSPHQVCNYANAVKIAMDFVSPERVAECSALTKDFARLTSPHPRSHDNLQLAKILWYTFATKKYVPEEETPVRTPRSARKPKTSKGGAEGASASKPKPKPKPKDKDIVRAKLKPGPKKRLAVKSEHARDPDFKDGAPMTRPRGRPRSKKKPASKPDSSAGADEQVADAETRSWQSPTPAPTPEDELSLEPTPIETPSKKRRGIVDDDDDDDDDDYGNDND